MFSRSLSVLARSRPPFASFYKSMSSTLANAPAPKRMRVASALWHKTAPRYGIRYSVPRVNAAKQIYKNEGSHLVKAAGPAAPARRHARKARQLKRQRKVSKAVTKTTAKKLKKKSAKRRTGKSTRAKPTRKAAKRAASKPGTPFASFTTKVLKEAKLAPTSTNKKRVFRMWVMTAQQRSLSMSKRVSMAVRLLTKDQKSKRKLSKKVSKKSAKKAPKRKTATRKTRRGAAKKKKASKTRRAAAKKAAPAKKKKRLATKKKAATRRLGKSAVKAKARKTRRKATAKGKSRKAAARRVKAKAVSKASTKPKARRFSPTKKTAARTTHHRRENPYIEFYRRVRMTGLLPNGRKVVGSRKIKELWARTHALPNIDARVAQATKILEARTGAKAAVGASRKTVAPAAAPAPAAAAAAPSSAAPAAAIMKDVKVPSYYQADPFSATYAALLPKLQDIPRSTRMARVAKAWTNTTKSHDHRSAKQRIAAVANELKK